MAFSRLWPNGLVDLVDKLFASKMNSLDVNQSRAIDGTAGGVYAPSAAIEINGTSKLKLGHRMAYASRAVKRFQPLAGAHPSSDTYWNFSLGSGYWEHISVAASAQISVPLILPHGNVLDGVTVRLQGIAGHTWPIGTPPKLRVLKIGQDGAVTELANVNDPSGSAAAYEVAHSIATGALAHTIDLDDNWYMATIYGENGANSLANAKYFSVWADCTVTDQSEF